jgi:hypothetical protein
VRYLALATLIVLGAVAIILRLPAGHRTPGGEVRFSSSTATPGPPQNGDVSQSTPRPVTGEAPWALSALPECLRQDFRRDGTPAFARIGFPKAAVRLSPGSRFRIADCTFMVGTDTIAVQRGADRLIVPPAAHLYRSPGKLVLERTAYGRDEVRVYSVVSGTL